MDTNKIQNMMAVASRGNHQGYLGSVQNGIKPKVLHNAAPTGYEADITTLTKIKTKVIEQKFYDKTQLNPADFVPIKVGEGAFTDESLYYKNFSIAGSFGSGIIGQGTGTRKGKSEALFDKVRLANFFWAKELDYSLIEVQQAAMNLGSAISLISAKEKAQKINWDLGIQETAFLGQNDITEIDGLLTLNNQGVNINTTDLTKSISSMTSTEINTFVSVLIKIYRANTNNTAWPNTFLIPEADHLGLASFVSDVQTQRSKLDFLEQAFKQQTQNSNFKIGRAVYCNKDRNTLAVNRYVLYNNANDTLEMNIPIDYTSTSFATGNGFDFASVAYGQFSGVIALRPAEVLYFDNTVNL